MKQDPPKYDRATTCRKDFFANTLPDKINRKGEKIYHCAYCGRKLKKNTLEVDHIIPVDAVKNHYLPRLYIKLFGLKSINSPKNLTASCHRCNAKKSKKRGFWIVRGYLGKHKSFWITVRVLFFIFVVGIFLYCEKAQVFHLTIT